MPAVAPHICQPYQTTRGTIVGVHSFVYFNVLDLCELCGRVSHPVVLGHACALGAQKVKTRAALPN